MFDVVLHGTAVAQGASPQQCWDVVTDHAQYAEWNSDTAASRIVAEGSDEANGLGAIREFTGLDGGVYTEVINHFWAPDVFGYHLLDGAPLKDHQGVILLHAVDGGTRIDWYMTSNNAGDASITPMLQEMLPGTMDRTVSELAAACEKHAQ